MRPSMDHTIGIGTPLHHLAARQLYTKMATLMDRGHHAESMVGTWGHPEITTAAIIITYPRHGRTASLA